MKAQFKYAFRAGMSPRLYAFAVILVLNLAFIIPGMLGLLPLAAMITGVSLSGTAISVMLVFNIIGDISIIRTMFHSQSAVLYALTPAPRRTRLIASITAMTVMDFVTMFVSIIGVSILGLNLGSTYSGMTIMGILSYAGTARYSLISLAILLAFYLFIIMLVIFCRAMRKSTFYNKRAGGFLTFLLAVGILYIFSASPLLLAPFGTVGRFYGFFTVTLGYLGMGMYALLMLIFAAVMFVLTANIMERKMNI